MGTATTYPDKQKHTAKNLAKLAEAQPDVMKGFRDLHRAAVAPRALDTKTKELISLAISVAARCDDCIAFHVKDALRAGASEDEITDTLGVAVMMGGGPAMMYASHVVEAVEQYKAAQSA